MRFDTIIIDASPLIVLYKSGLLEILPQLFGNVLVPEAVWTEIAVGGATDAAASSLPLARWARRTSVAITDPRSSDGV